MKKQLMGLAACALILSSCSQNQEIENYEQMNREEVRLAPYVNKTKASVTDQDAMKLSAYSGFKVYALQHSANAETPTDITTITDFSDLPEFMNQLNVKYSTEKKWSYTGNYYWPLSENDRISFFAVAPDESTVVSPISKKGNTEAQDDILFTVTVPSDVNAQKDVIAGVALNMNKASGQVQFPFIHVLSRIGFNGFVPDNDKLKFKINSVSYAYKASTIKSKGIYNYNVASRKGATPSKGSITPQDGAFLATPAEENAFASYAPGKSVIFPNETVRSAMLHSADEYFMIVPQDLSSNTDFITLTIGYNVAVAGEAWSANQSATVQIPGKNFEMGKAYTYNLKFTATTSGLVPIVFGDPTVEKWDELAPGTEVGVPTPPAEN